MDGKQNLKLFNKLQLLSTFRIGASDSQLRVKNNKNITSFTPLAPTKRGSMTLISARTNSTLKKKTNSTAVLKKIQMNNYMSSAGLKNTANQLLENKATLEKGLGKRNYKKQQEISKNQHQKLLLKNSDKITKLLWNQLDEHLPPLIISASFVMDQDLFWQPAQINSNIAKTWKLLHRSYYVIWLINSQKNCKKLKDFAQTNQLPLNAIYYHKRQNRYTIDFCSLRKQLIKIYGSSLHQIKCMMSLKLNTKDIYEPKSFLGKIPIMYDRRLKVCYIRCEQHGQGLDKIWDACKFMNGGHQSKVIQVRSVKKYVHDYILQKLKDKQINKIGIFCQNKQKHKNIDQSFYDEQSAEKQVQQFRKQILQKMLKQKGRNFQYQGFSIHYLVGDIIKRNYNLLLQNALKRQQYSAQTKANQNSQQIEIQHFELGISQNYYQFCI